MNNDVVNYIKCVSAPDRPISGSSIASHFGITDVDVRKKVSEARKAGIPICSVRYGYYYSTDKSDIAKTIDSLRRRISSQESAITGLAALLT